jgi:hypothetical protein
MLKMEKNQQRKELHSRKIIHGKINRQVLKIAENLTF